MEGSVLNIQVVDAKDFALNRAKNIYVAIRVGEQQKSTRCASALYTVWNEELAL